MSWGQPTFWLDCSADSSCLLNDEVANPTLETVLELLTALGLTAEITLRFAQEVTYHQGSKGRVDARRFLPSVRE